jgi:hypothetical protein
MKHQLKIVMSYEDDNSTVRHLITNHNIIVYYDDEPIGGISKLKLTADAKEILPEIEMTFPDLHDLNIDPAYHTNPQGNITECIDRSINLLSQIPNVKINVVSLSQENDTNSMILCQENHQPCAGG